MRATTARRLGCALIAFGVLPFASAPASAKPTVRLTLPAQADAGAAVPYSFTASRVPSKAMLVIQRQMGTANRFRTVATLARARRGSGKLPGLGLGRRTLRIAVVGKVKQRQGKAKSVVLAQQRRTLIVFDDIKFLTLFRVGRELIKTTPSRTFPYVFSAEVLDNAGGRLPTVDKTNSTCRSVRVDFVFAPNGSSTGPEEMGIVSVIQESRDPVEMAAPVNTISAVDSPLTLGQAWGITARTQVRRPLILYINGVASCYA